MKTDTTKLLTIKNYALNNKVTPTYIYKLIKDKRMEATIIDGVQFIDTVKFPVLPTAQ